MCSYSPQHQAMALGERLANVLAVEAGERVANRGAISALRRRSMSRARGVRSKVQSQVRPPGDHILRDPTSKFSGTGGKSVPRVPPRHGASSDIFEETNGKVPDSFVDGSSSTQAGTRNVNGADSTNARGTWNTRASWAQRGCEEQGLAACWPSEDKHRRKMSGELEVTDTLPSKLSCGYCRKPFLLERLDSHEQRCPSRNPELFATPCVACGIHGPRCACWALRNGLLQEQRPERKTPIFALFRSSREEEPPGVTKAGILKGSSGSRKVDSPGAWGVGRSMRRPVPLRQQSDSEGNDNIHETPRERWMRERDDWLFGRTSHPKRKTPPGLNSPAPAPSCDANFDGVAHESGGSAMRSESDEAFRWRERRRVQSQLEKVRDAAKMRQYTERWFRFSNAPPAMIRHQDVPWLPRLSPLGREQKAGQEEHFGEVMHELKKDDESSPRQGGQEHHERFETLGVSEGDSIDAKKAAVRAASLRWHPDKFLTKYGPMLEPRDRGRIIKDVHVMMQRITTLKERLYGTGNGRLESSSQGRQAGR